MLSHNANASAALIETFPKAGKMLSRSMQPFIARDLSFSATTVCSLKRNFWSTRPLFDMGATIGFNVTAEKTEKPLTMSTARKIQESTQSETNTKWPLLNAPLIIKEVLTGASVIDALEATAPSQLASNNPSTKIAIGSHSYPAGC
ncbi:MAG: hypothetical protein K2W94_01095 [Alphaproteobacteria bacterium]|nr:hypothetical protein [Alphaproteobacteria bacterium]